MYYFYEIIKDMRKKIKILMNKAGVTSQKINTKSDKQVTIACTTIWSLYISGCMKHIIMTPHVAPCRL